MVKKMLQNIIMEVSTIILMINCIFARNDLGTDLRFHYNAAESEQMYLQDPATPYMEGLMEFNKHLLGLLVVIVLLVGWVLYFTLNIYEEFGSSERKNFFHSHLLEIVWTSVPAIALGIAAPFSFSLLYSLEELISPRMSFKVLGHQWFWSYEVSDFDTLLSCLPNLKKKNSKIYLLSIRYK